MAQHRYTRPSPPPTGFASALCTCADERWQWGKTRNDGWNDRCRTTSLAPAVGSTALQLWHVASVDGRPLVPGTVVTLQNLARAACGGYMSAAAVHCGSGRVRLSGDGQTPAVRWVLRAGPKPLSFMLESQGTGAYCPRRWLGAPSSCGADSLGMYAAGDPSAALVWLVLPA